MLLNPREFKPYRHLAYLETHTHFIKKRDKEVKGTEKKREAGR